MTLVDPAVRASSLGLPLRRCRRAVTLLTNLGRQFGEAQRIAARAAKGGFLIASLESRSHNCHARCDALRTNYADPKHRPAG